MTLSESQRAIANLLLVQAVWFACVLGGTLWAWLATAAYFGVYQWRIGRLQQEWRYWLPICLIGLLVDGTLSWLGFLQFPPADQALWPFLPDGWLPDGWLPNALLPGWLVALWLSFATLFLHGLRWLRTRPWLAAACGAVAGPATYYSGAVLNGVTLGITTEKFVLCLAILWAIMTPLFGAICASHHTTTEPAHG